MNGGVADHGLEFLLAFNGRIHHLEKGYWLKFEITRVETTGKRPHGLSYSLTSSTKPSASCESAESE